MEISLNEPSLPPHPVKKKKSFMMADILDQSDNSNESMVLDENEEQMKKDKIGELIKSGMFSLHIF